MKYRAFAPALSVLAAALFVPVAHPKLPPPTLPAFGLRMTARRRWKSRNAAVESAAKSSGLGIQRTHKASPSTTSGTRTRPCATGRSSAFRSSAT